MSNQSHDLKNHENLNDIDKKDYLLSKENFDRLIYVQKAVEHATEMRPTFKKLINGLVTDEALKHMEDLS